MIFDTHAHYDDKKFDGDRSELLYTLPTQGVDRIVNQGTSLETSRQSLLLAEKYDYIYAAVGVHPECLDTVQDDTLEQIAALAQHPKAVAIGEIGLDYYYEDIPRDLQQSIFESQLALSKELNMPVTVHDREAHGDTLALLKKYKPKGIVHCFSGSVEMAREIIKLGMYIGIGGVITFKNARKTVEVVQDIPLERLVLETDAPYLAPVPFRGKRCDSSMIRYTAQTIADILNRPVEDILRITRQNAFAVYEITEENSL
ncbi:MAG: TatD family hydrolase [Acutalibacteraceae bacterium]